MNAWESRSTGARAGVGGDGEAGEVELEGPRPALAGLARFGLGFGFVVGFELEVGFANAELHRFSSGSSRKRVCGRYRKRRAIAPRGVAIGGNANVLEPGSSGTSLCPAADRCVSYSCAGM